MSNNIFGSGIYSAGGVPGNPGYKFIDAEHSGLYFVNNEMGLSYQGVPMVQITGDGVSIRNFINGTQIDLSQMQSQINTITNGLAVNTDDIKSNTNALTKLESIVLSNEAFVSSLNNKNVTQDAQINSLLTDSNKYAVALDGLAKKMVATQTSLDLISNKLSAPFSAKLNWSQFDDSGSVNLNVKVDDAVSIAVEANAYIANPIFVINTNPLTLKTNLPQVMTVSSISGITVIKALRLRTNNIGVAFIANKNLYYQRSYDPEGLTWKEPQLLKKNVTALVQNIIVGSNPRVVFVKDQQFQYLQATESNANTWDNTVVLPSADKAYMIQNTVIFEKTHMIYYQNLDNNGGQPTLVADFHNHSLILVKNVSGFPYIVAKSNDDNKFYYVKSGKSNGSEWPTDPTLISGNFAKITDIVMSKNLVCCGIDPTGNALVDTTSLGPATNVYTFKQGSKLLIFVVSTDIKMYDYDAMATGTVVTFSNIFDMVQNQNDVHSLVLYPLNGRLAIRRLYDKFVVHIK